MAAIEAGSAKYAHLPIHMASKDTLTTIKLVPNWFWESANKARKKTQKQDEFLEDDGMLTLPKAALL